MLPEDGVAGLRRGVRDVSPIIIGIAPFGLVVGAAGVEAGLSAAQTMGLSVFVFAGASQLAVIELLGQGAGLWVVVITALVINARMLMYSASIASHILDFSRRAKLMISYVLTDQAYALSISRFERDDLADIWKIMYFVGVAYVPWIVWQVTTAIGIVIGASVPPALQLEFAVPLVFLALLGNSINTTSKQIAAVVGATVAVLWALYNVQYNLGILVGAMVGVMAGVTWESVVEEGAHEDG